MSDSDEMPLYLQLAEIQERLVKLHATVANKTTARHIYFIVRAFDPLIKKARVVEDQAAVLEAMGKFTKTFGM